MVDSGSTHNPQPTTHGCCGYCSGENAEGMTILFSWIDRWYSARPFFLATVDGGHTPASRILLRISQRSFSVLYGQTWRNLLSPPSSERQIAVTGLYLRRSGSAAP